MNRYTSDRTGRYQGPKVERVELSEKHLGLRLVLAIAFLLVGMATIAFTFSRLVGKSSGWQEVSVSSDSGVNNSNEFTLLYNLGSAGVAAGTESRAISAVYTRCCEETYQIFNSDMSFEGVGNLYEINTHPNETVEISPLLYEALSALEEAGYRYQYLGPLYRVMENLCGCETDPEARQFDYDDSPEYAAEFAAVSAFASDPDQIQLELLGDNTVCLHISDDYLSYASDNGISCFLDLSWMKNAFITDYIADSLIAGGYTFGVLSSYDGFSRYLDDGAAGYSFNVYNRSGQTVTELGTASIRNMRALVTLRDYPLSEQDRYSTYVYSDGTIRNLKLSPTDGRCHAALSSLTAAGQTQGCAELLLALLPVYISEEAPDDDTISMLCDSGIYTLYCVGGEMVSNIPDLTFAE